jgi:hypothetical protein
VLQFLDAVMDQIKEKDLKRSPQAGFAERKWIGDAQFEKSSKTVETWELKSRYIM